MRQATWLDGIMCLLLVCLAYGTYGCLLWKRMGISSCSSMLPSHVAGGAIRFWDGTVIRCMVAGCTTSPSMCTLTSKCTDRYIGSSLTVVLERRMDICLGSVGKVKQCTPLSCDSLITSLPKLQVISHRFPVRCLPVVLLCFSLRFRYYK